MRAFLRRFCVFLWIFCALPLAAQDFRAFADDIAQRLDATDALYQEGKTDEAKQKVQMAYFEVFENLEGPIRINRHLSKPRSCRKPMPMLESEKAPLPVGEGLG